MSGNRNARRHDDASMNIAERIEYMQTRSDTASS